jgi:hypothetical protein
MLFSQNGTSNVLTYDLCFISHDSFQRHPASCWDWCCRILVLLIAFGDICSLSAASSSKLFFAVALRAASEERLPRKGRPSCGYSAFADAFFLKPIRHEDFSPLTSPIITLAC